EDEIGLGESHAGIMVLRPDASPGTMASDYFNLYEDVIFEIGLTPNRSDAMSHLGVARDICAYLTHHTGRIHEVKNPLESKISASSDSLVIKVTVEDGHACPRYAGVSISGIKIKPSPDWLQKQLKAIGQRPINNVVDITNFILHETGQPLHAFDADQIKGRGIRVKKLSEGTLFRSLDDKERKLNAEDLMICDDQNTPLCIGGVFGGLLSGVSEKTSNIFLESAWFDPTTIRKTSFRHQLRTDAAMRFEKGVDIGNTVEVLKRAASMIVDIAGGNIASEIIDVYPVAKEKQIVSIRHRFLYQLSGKLYGKEISKTILEALGFGIISNNDDELKVSVPLHKTDISLPADLAEEIMRIDGFDNIDIPSTISITPSTETLGREAALKEKAAVVLTGMGFNEILNNSITNSSFLSEKELKHAVKMMNNLSSELDSLRTAMLETGLVTVSHNLNRKNHNLRLFEFGKTYSSAGKGTYMEEEHLALYVTGKNREENWHVKKEQADIYFLKGIAHTLCTHLGISDYNESSLSHDKLEECISIQKSGLILVTLGKVKKEHLDRFDIKQEVFYGDFHWKNCIDITKDQQISFTELPKYPAVQRDLAFVVNNSILYAEIENTNKNLQIQNLKSVRLFDDFESEKIGKDKKSMAINLVFLDSEKTMTDQEIDGIMNKIIVSFEKEFKAEIRKA
ncbi:MAG: phenylalanine--tRNA ligase subunit beta, partial [Chitinophagaceae bacterium]